MKKAIVAFVLGALILTALAAWGLKGHLTGDPAEIARAGVVLLLVGFAVFFGVSRFRSRRHGEPAEDELSRKIMTRASSLAYYVSIYLWLFVGYISDKTTLPAHTLVGTGILGMAVVFLLCWLGVRFFGTKNV